MRKQSRGRKRAFGQILKLTKEMLACPESITPEKIKFAYYRCDRLDKVMRMFDQIQKAVLQAHFDGKITLGWMDECLLMNADCAARKSHVLKCMSPKYFLKPAPRCIYPASGKIITLPPREESSLP